MVKEVECSHCHVKVLPEKRFSTFTFAVLLVLGLLPFTLILLSYILVFDTFYQLFRKPQGVLSYPMPTPMPMPPEFTLMIERAVLSLGLLSISYLILSLIIGLIPAVIYLAVRRGSYKCPECDLPIS